MNVNNKYKKLNGIGRSNNEVIQRLQNIKNNNITVIVGDANGVDKLIQQYFNDELYDNVTVYATNGITRNNIGNWDLVAIKTNQKNKDFNYYAAKDREMARDCDYGFIIWNGESKGTLNNMINLVMMNKKVLVYLSTQKKFYTIDSLSGLEVILETCNFETKQIYRKLLDFESKPKQLSII